MASIYKSIIDDLDNGSGFLQTDYESAKLNFTELLDDNPHEDTIYVAILGLLTFHSPKNIARYINVMLKKLLCFGKVVIVTGDGGGIEELARAIGKRNNISVMVVEYLNGEDRMSRNQRIVNLSQALITVRFRDNALDREIFETAVSAGLLVTSRYYVK